MNVVAHAAIECCGEAGFWGIGCLVGACAHEHRWLGSRYAQWAMVLLFNLATAPVTVWLVG